MHKYFLILFLYVLIYNFPVSYGETYKGIVIDKWTVTTKICLFENYCEKRVKYFIAIDSIYDDLLTPKELYGKIQKGDYIECYGCYILNELNKRDKE